MPRLPGGRGNEEQIGRADTMHERGRERSTHNAAERSPDTDETEKTLCLLGVEDVRHESPEDSHDEEIEDADPDVEGAPDPHLLRGSARCA